MRALTVTRAARMGLGLAALLCLTLAAPSARANSVFSSAGLGEPTLEESARLRALGGAGAAEHGPSNFSLVNPASIAEAEHLILEATLLQTRRQVTTLHYGDETGNESSFPSVRLVLRLPNGLVLGGSYLIGTNGEFQVTRPESTGAASVLRIDGRGGINFLRVTAAAKVGRSLRAGVDYEVAGGSFHEEWQRQFVDPNLAANRDTLDVSWDRLGRWRFGAQWVKSWISLGAAYETGRRLPLTERQKAAGSLTETANSLGLPEGIVLGFELKPRERTRFVGQYRRQNYGESTIQSDLVTFRPLERYSIGWERMPVNGGRAGLGLQRIPLRLGFMVLRWPDLLPVAGATDIGGGAAAVEEWAASIGTGLRTKDGGGAIDLSLEGGQRGDKDKLGAMETFFRLGLSLRVSDETWR
ncbi:MAG TPA: hypothetical protein VFR25_04635 [Candidatus Eisenbacteria bacterium]|nr:hypothetical protein [Candidatus Eisenbacteria bacterium]